MKETARLGLDYIMVNKIMCPHESGYDLYQKCVTSPFLGAMRSVQGNSEPSVRSPGFDYPPLTLGKLTNPCEPHVYTRSIK